MFNRKLNKILFFRYIISFLLDSTIGLLIIWAGIRLSIYIGRRKGYPTILFGEYGLLTLLLFSDFCFF